MIPFINSPVKLEGMPAGFPALQDLLPVEGSQVSEFATIMSDLNGHDVGSDKPSESPLDRLMAALGIDKEQAGTLGQLLGDGKKLPPAMQQLMSEIQQLANKPALTNEQLAVATEKLASLIDKLPQQARNALQKVVEHLEARMGENLPVENAPAGLSDQAAEDVPMSDDEVPMSVVADEERPEAEQVLMSDMADDGVEPSRLHEGLDKQAIKAESSLENQSPQVDQSGEEVTDPLAHPYLKPEQANHASEKSRQPEAEVAQVPRSVIQANARNTAAVLNNNAAERSPAFFPENYGAPADAELSAEPEQIAVNLKNAQPANRQQLLNGLAASRLNSVMLHGPSASGQGAAFGSGAEGQSTGQGGMQGNAGGTSFLQMMTQSMPQPVTQNLHKPEWGSAVGERITWMIGNRMQTAQLRITPAHLGPIEMKISIEKQSAQVSFVSDHQVVRNALEQAIPRLRDMLQEQELDLVNVDIHGNETGDQKAGFSGQLAAEEQQNRAGGGTSADHASETGDDEETQMTQVSHSDHLLDTFA